MSNRKIHLFSQSKYMPFLYASVLLVLLLFGSFYYHAIHCEQQRKEIRTHLLETLVSKKSKLEQVIASRIYYTKGIAAYVAIHPEISTAEFDALAQELIRKDSVISTMSLAPAGVIQAIYPRHGHEAAIGLDLLEHPERRPYVEKAIISRKTSIAGPVELVEGGIAFIGFTPIFKQDSTSSLQFWGITDIVIKRDMLLALAGLKTTDGDFGFSLQNDNGIAESPSIFWGDSTILNLEPITIDVNLPNNRWILAAAPTQGWDKLVKEDKTLIGSLVCCSLVISILLLFLLTAHYKSRVQSRELKAIFSSMQNLIIMFSDEGEYLKIPNTNTKLLYKSEKELIGKKMHEIFPAEQAEFFMKAIRKCVKTQDLVSIVYPMKIDDEEYWFSAVLSYMDPKRVIINAYDITAQKKNEHALMESEQNLKDLNAFKDKFFSIIAHDLRSPVGSFKMLTNILLEDFETTPPEKAKEMLRSIHLASSNLYDLLENLLSWTHAQRNSLVINKQNHNLFYLSDDAADSQMANAKVKKIKLINHIQEDSSICCDQYITLTVIRNLLSNAIKFTPNFGEVHILSDEVSIDGKNYTLLAVKDSGIGIPIEKLEVIFTLDPSKITTGTNNESGSGLGLMLCREFVEKQGGFIKIKSHENRGTTVSCYFPR